MRLDQIEAAAAVAATGGFAAAAVALGLPQPTVSRRVAALEAEVGTRLFDREHGSCPTAAGLAFLALATPAAESARRAAAAAAQQKI